MPVLYRLPRRRATLFGFAAFGAIGTMEFHSIMITPAAALIAGFLILLMPRLLNLIVALYLILIGVLGLAPHLLR